MPRADRPAAGCGRRLRRRRQQRGRHVLPVRRRHAGRTGRRRGRRRGPSKYGEHAATLSHGKPGVLHGTLQLRAAGRRRPDGPRAFGLGRPRLPRRRPGAQLLEGHRPRALHAAWTTTGALEGFRLCCRLEGILPALETAHAVVEAMRIAASRPKDGRRRRSASPAAATRTVRRSPGWKKFGLTSRRAPRRPVVASAHHGRRHCVSFATHTPERILNEF